MNSNKMKSLNYAYITERMRQGGKLKNNSAVARVLGITPQALSNYKKKGEIPGNLVIKFAGIYGLSVDWLLTARGEPYMGFNADENKQLSSGSVDASSYSGEAGEFRKITDSVSLNLDEIIYLGKLLRILRTIDKDITAGVKCCIDAFAKIIG